MFRQMRRSDREISGKQIEQILIDGEFGTLATICENGYPYSVALSYVYFDNCIFFHCAKEGQKLDNIAANNKVSFSVVLDTEIEPSKFGTKYKSVIAFGTCIGVFGEQKEIVLKKLIEKYAKDFLVEGKEYINRAANDTKVMQISIQHLTGKAKV